MAFLLIMLPPDWTRFRTYHYLMPSIVDQQLHSIIKNNNRQKFPKLIRENQPQLVEKIESNGELETKFSELFNHREYYLKKLGQFLESLVNAPVSEPYIGPQDPTTIANRHHALKYCQARLSQKRRQLIRDRIADHWAKQEKWSLQRQAITDEGQAKITALEEKKKGGPNLCGKMKLAFLAQQGLDNANSELREKLAKFDQSVHDHCKQIARENEKFLRESRIPFYCLQPGFEYPEIEADQVWMLQQLQEMLIDA